MGSHYHAIVWIDHHEAKIFHFDSTEVDSTTIRSSHPHQHIHHKANARDSGHAPVDTPFLQQVAHAGQDVVLNLELPLQLSQFHYWIFNFILAGRDNE